MLINASPKKISEIEQIVNQIDEPGTQLKLKTNTFKIVLRLENSTRNGYGLKFDGAKFDGSKHTYGSNKSGGIFISKILKDISADFYIQQSEFDFTGYQIIKFSHTNIKNETINIFKEFYMTTRARL